MSVAYPSLATFLKSIGNALVLAGAPGTASGLTVLGLKEGQATVDINDEYSYLTAPDQTGPTKHEGKHMGDDPVITIPMIIANEALYATLSPTGTAGSGADGPLDVVTTSLVLVPESDFGAGPWSFTTPTWSPAAPKHAVWFWRGHFLRPGLSFRIQEGGKRVEQVRFQVMRSKTGAPANVTLPVGHKLYTIGDPAALGVTGLAI